MTHAVRFCVFSGSKARLQPGASVTVFAWARSNIVAGSSGLRIVHMSCFSPRNESKYDSSDGYPQGVLQGRIILGSFVWFHSGRDEPGHGLRFRMLDARVAA